MAPLDPEVEQALDRLSLLLVEKDLFLSDWYARSAYALFDEEGRDALLAIADESRAEAEETTPLLERWASEARPLARTLQRADDLAQSARRDFLSTLVEAKEAAALVYAKAAAYAPEDMRDAFRRLGELDHRHALRLRALLQRDAPHAHGAPPEPAGDGTR